MKNVKRNIYLWYSWKITRLVDFLLWFPHEKLPNRMASVIEKMPRWLNRHNLKVLKKIGTMGII